MKAGVLKETWPGETRVAVVPGVVPGARQGRHRARWSSRGRATRPASPTPSTPRRAPSVVAPRRGARGRLAAALGALLRGGPRPGRDRAARAAPRRRRLPRPAAAARGRRSSSPPAASRPSRSSWCRASRAPRAWTRCPRPPPWSATRRCCSPPTRLPRMMPMMMTAAGTIAPARVFVIGAGVAGLQAIATARRLGAVVEAYDVRPAVKEQIHSLGAKFVELPLETAARRGQGRLREGAGRELLPPPARAAGEGRGGERRR